MRKSTFVLLTSLFFTQISSHAAATKLTSQTLHATTQDAETDAPPPSKKPKQSFFQRHKWKLATTAATVCTVLFLYHRARQQPSSDAAANGSTPPPRQLAELPTSQPTKPSAVPVASEVPRVQDDEKPPTPDATKDLTDQDRVKKHQAGMVLWRKQNKALEEIESLWVSPGMTYDIVRKRIPVQNSTPIESETKKEIEALQEKRVNEIEHRIRNLKWTLRNFDPFSEDSEGTFEAWQAQREQIERDLETLPKELVEQAEKLIEQIPLKQDFRERVELLKAKITVHDTNEMKEPFLGSIEQFTKASRKIPENTKVWDIHTQARSKIHKLAESADRDMKRRMREIRTALDNLKYHSEGSIAELEMLLTNFYTSQTKIIEALETAMKEVVIETRTSTAIADEDARAAWQAGEPERQLATLKEEVEKMQENPLQYEGSLWDDPSTIAGKSVHKIKNQLYQLKIGLYGTGLDDKMFGKLDGIYNKAETAIDELATQYLQTTTKEIEEIKRELVDFNFADVDRERRFESLKQKAQHIEVTLREVLEAKAQQIFEEAQHQVAFLRAGGTAS